uniref:CSON010154 protein n=2 Tax=Culicoides sonorensis TaxID=179676 RepID=Q66U82_CULSO|nr:unknown salivary protein [Culicoides sonorensis]
MKFLSVLLIVLLGSVLVLCKEESAPEDDQNKGQLAPSNSDIVVEEAASLNKRQIPIFPCNNTDCMRRCMRQGKGGFCRNNQCYCTKLSG